MRNHRHRAITIVLAAVLSSCSTTAPAPEPSSVPSATAAAVATSSSMPGAIVQSPGVALGTNWGATESYRGQTFRWVDNDPHILVKSIDPDDKLEIELEPGPGITNLPMQLRITSGSVSSIKAVSGHMTIDVQPVGSTVTLHAINGGTKIATDPRILNFRVFRIATVPAVAAIPDDVIAPPIRVGANWGVLEHYNGDTFRWVDNDAAFTVPSGHHRTISITAESGPGIGSPKFNLHILDASGKQVASVPIASKQTVSVTLPDFAKRLRFHVNGGGKHIASDKRVLDFRIFHLGESTE